MDNELYYAEVQAAVDEIIVQVAKQTLQPKDGPRKDKYGKWTKDSGAVYQISVRNRAIKEHQEGRVTLVPYWLLAAGMVGPTGQGQLHRVADDSEIKKYLAEEQVKRDQIMGAAARLKGVATFTVPPVNENTGVSK